jgi:hypothetical protein
LFKKFPVFEQILLVFVTFISRFRTEFHNLDIYNSLIVVNIRYRQRFLLVHLTGHSIPSDTIIRLIPRCVQSDIRVNLHTALGDMQFGTAYA